MQGENGIMDREFGSFKEDPKIFLGEHKGKLPRDGKVPLRSWLILIFKLVLFLSLQAFGSGRLPASKAFPSHFYLLLPQLKHAFTREVFLDFQH